MRTGGINILIYRYQYLYNNRKIKVTEEHVIKANKLLCETIVPVGSNQVSLDEEDDVSFLVFQFFFFAF